MHYDSDLTINEAILRFIQASKFVVADFSGHRHGVYFETGYSLGLGKPVIYMCSKEDVGITHFDTNHYPHLVYRNLEELRKMLTEKIIASI
jgi:nucleoside 2-deoxyribosyltransferase